MHAARLLLTARRRAGLTQAALGRRAGVTQASISRIEEGKTSPRLETLERLLDACGFELEIVPREGAGIDRTAIRELLKLSPVERGRLAVVEARNMVGVEPPR